jgi:hypothetical protein
MPARLAVVGAIEATPLHLLPPLTSCCSKTTPSGGRTARSATIIRSGRPRSRVSPEQLVRGGECCIDDAFDKGATHKTPSSSAMTGVCSVFTGIPASPQPDPRCSHRKRWMHGDRGMPRPKRAQAAMPPRRPWPQRQPCSLRHLLPLPSGERRHRHPDATRHPAICRATAGAAAPRPNPRPPSRSKRPRVGSERSPAAAGGQALLGCAH